MSIKLTALGYGAGCRKWFSEFFTLKQNNNPIVDNNASITLFNTPGPKIYKTPLTAEEKYFSYFNGLYYSSEYQVGCVDMVYPYG